jgi:hypothetical protein
MPNALRIGLLGPLQVRDETGRPVHVGGRQLRVLLTLLPLNAGRVVPAGSLTGQIWPDDPPGNPEASGRLGVTAWFVPLAPVTDPAEVAYAVLDTLGIREPIIARRAAGWLKQVRKRRCGTRSPRTT